MSKMNMKTNLRSNAPASEWQTKSQELSRPVQTKFIFDRDSRVTATYETVRRALAKFGGADALRAALDERESYIATISKAMNGQDGRSVPLDWLPVLGEDREAAFEIASGINALLGFDPPVVARAVEESDVNRASRELLAEMDEEHREVYRRKLARKLGVRVEDVKL